MTPINHPSQGFLFGNPETVHSQHKDSVIPDLLHQQGGQESSFKPKSAKKRERPKSSRRLDAGDERCSPRDPARPAPRSGTLAFVLLTVFL